LYEEQIPSTANPSIITRAQAFRLSDVLSQAALLAVDTSVATLAAEYAALANATALAAVNGSVASNSSAASNSSSLSVPPPMFVQLRATTQLGLSSATISGPIQPDLTPPILDPAYVSSPASFAALRLNITAHPSAGLGAFDGAPGVLFVVHLLQALLVGWPLLLWVTAAL